jgi:hypothetical protein|tara:strand:- start:190 stop:348 length:159 start_codon:yes stop_codon:yes gene_type:complete
VESITVAKALNALIVEPWGVQMEHVNTVEQEKIVWFVKKGKLKLEYKFTYVC